MSVKIKSTTHSDELLTGAANLVTVFIFTTTSKYVAERELSADNLEDILAAAAEPMQLIRFCVYYLPNTAAILLTVYYWKLCQNTHLWRYD